MRALLLAGTVVVASAMGCAATPAGPADSPDTVNGRPKIYKTIPQSTDSTSSNTPSYSPSSAGASHSHTIGGKPR
jgi:hypothetical protein